MSGEPGVCDVCGKPATSFAVDVVSAPNFDEGWMEARPAGKVKRGCAEHPVESFEHRQEQPFTEPW